MEEILNIDLPGFKARYLTKWQAGALDEELNAKQINGLLFNDIGEILIINVVGNWQLPGGHIEPGESFEDCLKREISEEADVEVKDLSLLGHLKVSEIKNDIVKPEIIQLYYYGKISKVNKQTIDPAHNKLAERKFIKPEEFTNYVPWGNIGKEIIANGLNVFLKNFQ